MDTVEELVERWPRLGSCRPAAEWLATEVQVGLAARTIDAYGRSIIDFLAVCERRKVDPLLVTRAGVAAYVGDLRSRPVPRSPKRRDDGVGLSNATIQLRLVAVRLFFDHLVAEGARATNPVGRGTTGMRGTRGLVPREVRQPWVPSDAQWRHLLDVAREESVRNRTMLGFGYDTGLRREELCQLETTDVDPAHRTVRVRAETTKNSRARTVVYSASAGALLSDYLEHRRSVSRTRGRLWLSESRRNYGQPLSLWTWSKVIRALGDRAGLPEFSTHTLRHLCLTDLARSGWELHQIATFAGHRNPATTMQYIHLSGVDLAARLASSASSVHGWRTAMTAKALR